MRPNEQWTDIAVRAIRHVDARAIRSLTYPDDGAGGATKYLDVERWLAVTARRIAALDLKPRSRVLDIGTGCGYLPFVLALLGHECVATDCANRPALFRDVTKILGVHVIEHDIEPLVPLPDFGSFDVVTAFMVTFNGHQVKPWGVPEWRCFLDSCRAPRIVLELNREPPPVDSCYSPQLEMYFRSVGKITGHWPHVPEKGGHRVLIDRG